MSPFDHNAKGTRPQGYRLSGDTAMTAREQMGQRLPAIRCQASAANDPRQLGAFRSSQAILAGTNPQLRSSRVRCARRRGDPPPAPCAPGRLGAGRGWGARSDSARLSNSTSNTTVSKGPERSVSTRHRRCTPICSVIPSVIRGLFAAMRAANSPPLPGLAWNTVRTMIIVVLPLRFALRGEYRPGARTPRVPNGAGAHQPSVSARTSVHIGKIT